MNIEFLNTFITVLSTGAVTLLAVYFTNQANYKKLLLQTELDKEFKTKEIIREKLEELYLLTDIWLNTNVTHWMPYLSVMMGELTYNQALDLTIQQSEKNKHEFYRIKMIIDLYFPAIRKQYDEVLKVQSSINKILYDHKRDYKNGDIDGLKYAEPFLNEQKTFVKKSEILMQGIIGLQKTI
ncbi:MAG: hypothetical protein M0Q21_07075 [Ignavibacteriaceae bacterium]|nr:hypothetical protein [Ignavibacteriaceae bacterium]